MSDRLPTFHVHEDEPADAHTGRYPETDGAQVLAEFDVWFVAWMDSTESRPQPVEGDDWQDLFGSVGRYMRHRALSAWQAAWARAWGLGSKAGYERGYQDGLVHAYDDIAAHGMPDNSGPRYLGAHDADQTERLFGKTVTDDER